MHSVIPTILGGFECIHLSIQNTFRFRIIFRIFFPDTEKLNVTFVLEKVNIRLYRELLRNYFRV